MGMPTQCLSGVWLGEFQRTYTIRHMFESDWTMS